MNLRLQLQQLTQGLLQRVQNQLMQKSQLLDFLARRLISPEQQLRLQQQQIAQMQERLQLALQQQLRRRNDKLTALGNALQHLNPSAVLQRGYALVQNQAGQVIVNSTQIQMGDELSLQFGEGSAEVSVKKVHAQNQSKK